LVFYASFNLYAILILILDIGTLVSTRVPEIPVGAFDPLLYSGFPLLLLLLYGCAYGALLSSFFYVVSEDFF